VDRKFLSLINFRRYSKRRNLKNTKNFQHRIIRTSSNELKNYHTSTCQFYSNAEDSEVWLCCVTRKPSVSCRGSLSSSIRIPKRSRKRIRRFRRQSEQRTEINVFLTSGTALVYVPKLLSIPVNMVQLQLHGIIQGSWRNRR